MFIGQNIMLKKLKNELNIINEKLDRLIESKSFVTFDKELVIKMIKDDSIDRKVRRIKF